MSKQAVFTMKLESELRDSFMAEAASEDRPASQVVRECLNAKRVRYLSLDCIKIYLGISSCKRFLKKT